MSSTKFVFFGPIRKPRCGNKCGTLYSGARYVALWASCYFYFLSTWCNLPSVIDRSNLSPNREVICRVSSTGQIYHRAAKQRGANFDRSMTRGKLLHNDTQLFILISILIMTQLHPSDPENRQQNRFSEQRFSKKKTSYNRLNGKAWRGLGSVYHCSTS